MPERHVGSWSHCANQHFINQYSKCIKKIFPREGSACHILFFHNTRVQNTQTHKIITGLMKPAFCIYTISHTLVFVQKKKNKKNAQNLKKTKQKNMQYTAMSVPFLSFLYTYIIGLPFTVITSHFTGITIRRLIQYKDDALPVQEFPLCRYDNLRTILSSQW